jgi:hypothetical protein
MKTKEPTLKLSADEKRKIMVEKYGERDVQSLTAKIWMLIGSLNASLYGIAEMEPNKLNHMMKKRFNDLRLAINLFLNNFKKSAEKKEQEVLDAHSFEAVGAMAELVCMVVQVPEDQLEWYLEECKKLTFLAYNKHVLEHERKRSEGAN